MSSLKELYELGKELGYEGQFLAEFVKDEHERDRQLQAGQEAVDTPVMKVRGPSLPYFDESKDDMDSYFRRFEMFATTAKWGKDSWAILLSSYLQGSSLEVYGRLSEADATNYDKLKYALMDRFECTEEGFRKRFRNGKPKRGEKVTQFVQRLRTNLSCWVELSIYGTVLAVCMCMERPICDVIVGNLEGATQLQNPEETVNAVVTRSAAKLSTRPRKMLKIPTLPSGVELMNAHNMKEAQQQDSSLARWMTYAKEGMEVSVTATTTVVEEEAEDMDSTLVLPAMRRKHTWKEVYINPELSDNQKHEVREILEEYGYILSDVPGKTDLVQHKINLVQE
ncbi:hypothetical protein Pcinc_006208 [Petrolisthes cinctipes]|uniref:SCAN box domain-containing protein n=1 Tax=Petrolisthes cinctipes TaxID=88211 RepID=A0AAE1GC06_PETCI|nr:hypothetical protein Pcinc_006208 [Petrolisthes cinctipes]